MKKLTMVLRCGAKKTPANQMVYTLVGDDYSCETIRGDALAKAIASGKVEVTNLAVNAEGNLVSSNGAMDKYTLIDEMGHMVGKPCAVVLNRIENEKGLVGYTVYNCNGVLEEINVAKAVDLAVNGFIANGKIRETSKGKIVSSIKGDYPIRVLAVKEKAAGEIKVELLFFGSAISGARSTKYAGMIVSSADMKVLSDIYGGLSKSNTEVISKIKEISGDNSEGKELSMVRTGTNGFYGVYSVNKVLDMIEKAGKKISLPTGTVTIAATDYAADKEESNLTLKFDEGKMTVVDKNEGTAKATATLKNYASALIDKLKEITVA